MTAVLPPAVLGIVDCGNHRRGIAAAAHELGYRTSVIDHDDLHRLAGDCRVIVATAPLPPGAADGLPAGVTLCPSQSCLEVCADRIAERSFLGEIGVPVVAWRAVHALDDLQSAPDDLFPAALTPVVGGSAPVVCDHADDAEVAWRRFDDAPCILERHHVVDRELSLLVARDRDGRTACYPVADDRRVNGVLDTTTVPADLPGDGHAQAAELCRHIAASLDLVGLLHVQMLVVGNDVYVGRLHPGPHDSGGYTLDACATGQYEQLVRAVFGLGLGDTDLCVGAAATVQLTGALWVLGEPDWSAALEHPGAHLHVHRDDATDSGRPTGHLTVTSTDAHGVATLARRLRQQAAATHQR